jgi:transcriptional regulator with XRE-family HTH domain
MPIFKTKSGSEELYDYLSQDKDFREAYNRPSLAYAMGRKVAEARVMKGITQKELAELIKTSQPNIARIESGFIDSISLFERIGKALKTDILPANFGCLLNNNSAETQRTKIFFAGEPISGWRAHVLPSNDSSHVAFINYLENEK